MHGDQLCTVCHTDITDVPHGIPLKKVSCGSCHTDAAEALIKSDHGKALHADVEEAKACLSCHGNAHTITGSDAHGSWTNKENISKTCTGCHEKSKGTPSVNSYLESVHGTALIKKGLKDGPTCASCHGAHDINKATNPASKLFWQKIPATCGTCHTEILKNYTRSIHGKAVAAGKREAPVCTDCHGEHSIDAVNKTISKVSPAHITETCGQCHSAERITTKYQLPSFVVNTYMESYHGLSARRGSVTAANCASCHGTHEILPSTDPASSIYPGNLVKTCGQCHAGIGNQVANGKIHSGTRPGLEDRATNIVRRFYLVLIILVIGMMLFHNGLDLLKKMRAHYRHMASLGKPVRMGTNERIQHVILLTTFIALAYTGFALKYPQAWWAAPFTGASDWRGLGHRIAAALFSVLAVYHVWFMLFTKKGRWQLNALTPRKIDAIQFGQTFAYYLGKRKDKPRPAFYGYIEKMEYWALVWGSLIMMITGALMLSKVWFLNHLPKWFFDAITAVHYYEAILACLAILIWHWYFVIFDPDVYPMKWTWLTGDSAPADDEREQQP